MAKAITLIQPYADMTVKGVRKYETRRWNTSYRGRLYIHAANRNLVRIMSSIMEWYSYSNKLDLARVVYVDYLDKRLLSSIPRGCIVGYVDLVDVFKVDGAFISRVHSGEFKDITIYDTMSGEFNRGWYVWVLKNPVMLDVPIKVSGKRGLWDFDM